MGANNRETDTNRNNDLSTFEEDREDGEIRKNTKVMRNSPPILSVNLGMKILHHL